MDDEGSVGESIEEPSPIPARVLGAVATLAALGGIALAIRLDPTFSWTADALSDLGVRDRSAPAFNGGLVLGGLAGLGYAAGLWVRARESAASAAGRLRAVVFALAMVAMAGVGVFDLTRALHAPAAVGFYLLVTVVFGIDGLARRDARTGRVALAFVPVHVAVWATFLAGLWPVTGLALPELPGAFMLAAWVWLVGPLPVVRRRSVPSRGGDTDGH
ncbi:DUF998 domain-containing protein [Halorubrum aethiopicum]|uniref:DUF998 domain-containing protein n=1 Tax=Halorubrum aethiopicum TaxID=1758255 RepID=UPI0008360060|nr:DUF998 domain-containing protein [Halorubrum aethiopicum]